AIARLDCHRTVGGGLETHDPALRVGKTNALRREPEILGYLRDVGADSEPVAEDAGIDPLEEKAATRCFEPPALVDVATRPRREADGLGETKAPEDIARRVRGRFLHNCSGYSPLEVNAASRARTIGASSG